MAFIYFSLFMMLLIFGLVDRGHAMINQTVRVSVVMAPPYLYQTSHGEYEGFIPDILQQLSDYLGYINFTIGVPKDGQYGIRYTNGSWSGMMGQLINDEVDMAGPLTVTLKRSKAIDFSYPVYSIGPVIVMKRPLSDTLSLEESLSKLFHPLELSVWLITVLALLVTGTVLYIVAHFNPYEWRRLAKDKEASYREAESFTCMNTFWFVVSTFAWQGYARSPRSIGARLIVTAWWVFVMIFVLAYTACLTNYLSVGPQPLAVKGYTKVRSLKDLTKQEEIKIGMIPNGATMTYFKESSNLIEHYLYDKWQKDFQEMAENLSSSEKLIDYLRGRPLSDFAVILESDMAKYFTHKEPCDLYMVSEGTVTRHNAFGFALGSSLQVKISQALMSLHETGKLTPIADKWFKSRCSDTVYNPGNSEHYKVPEFYQMDLGTFSGAILILACGIVLGGIVTIVEICTFKWAELQIDDELPEVEKSTNRDTDMESDDTPLKTSQSDTKQGGATQV